MVGVEFDMVVSDSLKALELYKQIFDIEVVEKTNVPKGENEVVFNLYGVRFHMLDENPKFSLVAPNPGTPITTWFNIIVTNIKETYEKAMSTGCKEVQALTEMPDYGISNAIFIDKFGYMWMLHQIHKIISHEERIKLWEEKNK